MIDTIGLYTFRAGRVRARYRAGSAGSNCTASNCASRSFARTWFGIKISRGGVFDETPTFAFCVDPFVDAVDFTVDHGADAVRVATSAMTVTLGP